MYIKEQFTPTRWLHIFQSAVSLKLSSIGMSKTCRKSRRWEGTVLHSMPSNHQKNGFTMKRKATAILMNGINRRTADFCAVLDDKSYYHRFTAIKFAKPSWRSPHSVIPFIANPTKFVEKYRVARIYSPWRFLPPRNTPDSFCRRFTRQNHRCAAWAVFFFFTNKILCSCSIFQNLFLVVDRTTSKCYSYAWKKQVVVSALRPAFFILYLESYISRLNEILRHDLTLSVGEPDNAAAKQG